MPLVIQNKAERQRDTSLEPVFKKHLIAIRPSICVVRTVNTVWPIRAGIRLTGRQKHNSEAWEEAPTSTKNSKDGCWTGREAKSSDVLEMGVEPEQELPLTHAQCLWSHPHRHIYKSPGAMHLGSNEMLAYHTERELWDQQIGVSTKLKNNDSSDRWDNCDSHKPISRPQMKTPHYPTEMEMETYH